MSAELTSRERLVRTLTGRETDRVPFIKLFGGTNATIPSWTAKRPELATTIDERLRFEGRYRGWDIVPVNFWACGTPGATLLREDEKEKVIRTGLGGIEIRRKADFATHVAEYPVKGWDEWLPIKERYLDPADPRRMPKDWDDLVTLYAKRDWALQLTCGGVYGFARNLAGDEGLAYLFFDDPALVDDMIGTYVAMCLALWERLAARVDFDLIECWEDMSFKGGPMVSPAIFERFLAPHYRKIRAFADAHRIPIVLVDSDGNTEALARWMAAAGVNAMYPFEVQAGNDVARVLSGLPGFAALGGVDKNCMAGEPLAADVLRAIEREMEKAERLIRGGRFIPGPDHFVLSDVPFENYERFMIRLREVVLATKPGSGS